MQNEGSVSNRLKGIEAKLAGARARAAAGASGALGPTFVFRPGGVAGGNVYTTWASLMASVGQRAGPKTIEIDSSLAAAHMTAGAWNLDACTLSGFYGAGGVGAVLTVDEGAVLSFTKLVISGGLDVVCDATATYPVTATELQRIELRDYAQLSAEAGAVAFWHVPNGIIAALDAFQGSLGDDTHTIVQVDAGGSLYVTTFGLNGVQHNAIAGAGTVSISYDATSPPDMPQPGTQTALSESYATSYGAGVPGNWQPAPAFVNAALDQLAAPNAVTTLDPGQAAAAAITIPGAAIAKKKNGQMRVKAHATVTTTGAATLSCTLLKDGVAIAGAPVAKPALAAAGTIQVWNEWIDTAADANNHTYAMSVAASAGTVASTADAGGVVVSES